MVSLREKFLIYDYKILDSEISRIKYEIGYSKRSLVENVTVLNSNINLDIKDYDYIYFINVDTGLKKDFNIEDNSFYKVDKDKNRVIKLNYIY